MKQALVFHFDYNGVRTETKRNANELLKINFKPCEYKWSICCFL